MLRKIALKISPAEIAMNQKLAGSHSTPNLITAGKWPNSTTGGCLTSEGYLTIKEFLFSEKAGTL